MKKRFIELLCKSAGLHNIKISTYRTDGADGQFAIGVGYEVTATNKEGLRVVYVMTPEGFNHAVAEVMEQIYDTEGIVFDWIATDEFKV